MEASRTSSIWETSHEYSLAVSLCPSLNCDDLATLLEARSETILEQPTKSPERQLLAALRLRARCLSISSFAARDRTEGLTYWLALQGGSPLAA